jgi:zinc protease
LNSPDRFGLEVLSHVLAGQGGRLFEELRERRGLVYRISAFSLEGVDPGYFAVYFASSPDKLEEALQTVRLDLQKMVENGITDQELDRAQRYLIGSHAIGLQRKGSLAAALAFHEAYGEGWDAYRKFPQRIRKVTRAEVLRLARKYLNFEHEVLAIVKPAAEAPAAAAPQAVGSRAAKR